MGRFSRSWSITKSSFAVINADKEMLLFPVLGGVLAIILLVLFALPFATVSVFDSIVQSNYSYAAYIVVFFVYYVCAAIIATFCNVGVVYIAKRRFEGGNATFSDAWVFAWTQIGEIIAWGIVSGIVGVALKVLQGRRNNSGIGRVVARNLLGVAWAIATIFVVPIIVCENVSPFQAIKKSVGILKHTWGESMIRYVGLGFVQGIFNVAGIVLAVGVGFFLLPAFNFVVLATLVILLLVYLTFVNILFSVANQIFNTALYIYATTGVTPVAYSTQMLDESMGGKPNTSLQV